MKIIIYVDFANSEFNRDFALSSELTLEHTVLLVTSREQLDSSIGSYDLVLQGFSCNEEISALEKPLLNLHIENDLVELENILKG